ncbi:MAG: phosphoribulokinase, partial [bacterium]|nr:phosphoribulokinase [bacterium]
MPQEPSSCSLLQTNLTRLKTPFIIGISGDSGSGKTTFSDGIRRILGPTLVKTIQMDGYHKENREQRVASGRTPLDPEANHLDTLIEHLNLLKQNKPAMIPIYNHATGDFDPPVKTMPSPIIILEGLHALYPEILPLIDFSIFVDPSRDVKWQWKFERDVKKRGHRAEKLEEEMLKREAAYKRWIDFQKTGADIVIKIFPSRTKDFARYDFVNPLSKEYHKVELLMRPAAMQLPTVPLPFDLATIVDIHKPPFLLATAPCRYWGRSVIDIHIDGAIPQTTISALEAQISSCTDIPISAEAEEGTHLDEEKGEVISATHFAQLIIAWRFLEQVNDKMSKLS